MLILSFYFFFLGAIIGSFLLCLADRMLIGENIYSRSYCPHCKNKLPFFALVPILSYLFLRARCYFCKKKISYVYLAIEIICGAMFVFIWQKIGLQWNIFYFFVGWSILLLIAILDWKKKWFYTYLLVLLFIIRSLFLFFFSEELLDSFLGMLIGAGFFYFVAFFYQFITKKEGLGDGDISLLGLLGYLFGWQSLLPTVIYGSFLGILLGFFFLWKNKTNQSFPFTPALILGAFAHWIYPQFYLEKILFFSL